MSLHKAIIVEDDINSARVLAHLLSKEDFESTIITDISKLDNYLDESPDIVFIDLEMPRMNGYSVLETLQDKPYFNTIPLVASSVHTSEINEVRDAGFHSFIGKPLSKEIFPGQLQRIMAGEHVWETA